MKKILVVERHEDVRNTIKQYLENYGFVVLTASNTDDAVQCIKKNDVGGLLIDCDFKSLEFMRVITDFSTKCPGKPVMAMAASDPGLGFFAGMQRKILIAIKPLAWKTIIHIFE